MGEFPRLRDDLTELTGYHSPQVDVPVRLNTNESPYAPPEAFLRDLESGLRGIDFNRYPDRAASELHEATASFLGHPVERVFCANGSNEVLQCLLLAYGGAGRRATVFRPTYLLHEHIARITGTEVVAGGRKADFTVDPDEARRVLAEASPEITFLCSPNNPTGVVDPRETVDAVLAAAPGLVVIDEAYGEFASWSALELVADDRPLVVVRTFSKVWSLAALRLGCAVGPPRVIDDLAAVTLPYHLSAPTQLAGRLALGHVDEMRRRVDTLVAERERVQAALEGMAGVEVWPSGANFLLFRPAAAGAQRPGPGPGAGIGVWKALLDNGVLVRDCSSWDGLDGCLRVSIGTPEENDLFLTALEAATQ
ncbi:MAG: histidinol-phosphate transaminase [Actinobacteria bacterium]|nr:histidinol-phosphate transaminase [Actinomycetota bacterium]